MGVSRIHVTNLSGPSESPKQLVFEVQSDSTLHEIIQLMKLSASDFQTSENSDPLVLYDCTLYPPKDFSEQVQEYSEASGPKAITIEALGWFPSAKLVIFRENDKEAREYLHSSIHTDEDFEYNTPSSHVLHHETNAANASKPKPSEIFQAVEKRFTASEDIEGFENVTKVKKQTEEERRAKIHERLKRLELIKKQNKVSNQVKKMLIKSGAIGDKKIRMEDRFYLEIILLDERFPYTDDDKSEYHFFSRSGTIGHVIASRTNGLDLTRNHMAELLVALDDPNNETVLRRLPTTMPLYDAIHKDILNEFDQVVVRIYDSTESTATDKIEIHSSDHGKIINECSEKNSDGSMSKEQQILKAVRDLDSNTKSNAVSLKVHQLLVKGKSKGDKKIKNDDRFYFEKILIQDLKFKAKSEFVFVDRGQNIANIFPTEKECFLLKGDKLTAIDTRNATGRIDCVIIPYSRIVCIDFS
jgi:hypothetical protein